MSRRAVLPCAPQRGTGWPRRGKVRPHPVINHPGRQLERLVAARTGVVLKGGSFKNPVIAPLAHDGFLDSEVGSLSLVHHGVLCGRRSRGASGETFGAPASD